MKYSILAAVVCALCASATFAQIPAGSRIAMSSFVPNNEVLYFDLSGNLLGTTTLMGGGTAASSIEPSRDNRSLIVTDLFSVYSIDQATGALTSIFFNTRTNAAWGCHGERDDFFSFRTGLAYRHDITYVNDTVFTSLNASSTLNTGCWDGSTGGVVIGEFAQPTPIRFVDDAGTITRSVALPNNFVSGCDWNPFDGSVMVSTFGVLYKIDRAGGVRTITSTAPAVTTANSVEVREGGSETYLVTEFGGPPQQLLTIDPLGNITTLASTSGTWGPSDACYIGSRQIWTTSGWLSGSSGNFYFNSPANAGDFYQIAASFSTSPGIRLGATGTVHLVPDDLFSLSTRGLGIFVNFTGQLDAIGTPITPPFVNIPPGLGGLGLRVFFAGVTFRGGNITSVTNVCAATIR